MRKIWLAVVLLVACGGDGADPAPLQPCRPAAEEGGLVAQRLTGGATELRWPTAVPLNRPVGQYSLIVAGEVGGEVGAWGVGPWLGGVRILAVDPTARRWSDWGAAIADDTAAGAQRTELAGRPELEAARACVSAASAAAVPAS